MDFKKALIDLLITLLDLLRLLLFHLSFRRLFSTTDAAPAPLLPVSAARLHRKYELANPRTAPGISEAGGNVNEYRTIQFAGLPRRTGLPREMEKTGEVVLGAVGPPGVLRGKATPGSPRRGGSSVVSGAQSTVRAVVPSGGGPVQVDGTEEVAGMEDGGRGSRGGTPRPDTPHPAVSHPPGSTVAGLESEKDVEAVKEEDEEGAYCVV